MEAAIHSIRSELDEKIQHCIEKVMMCVNHKTQNFHKELNERIEITQVELWSVEVSLDTQARKLQEDLATIGYDHLRDYNLTHIKVQAMRNKTAQRLKPPDASSSLSWK
jgi:predicted component of viral defense system (DUF524 family)